MFNQTLKNMKDALFIKTMDNDMSPLHQAAWLGDLEMIQAVLKGFVDVNEQDEIGMTALHYAACGGSLGVIFALVLAGADVNIKDSFGDTPLHRAIESENIFAI